MLFHRSNCTILISTLMMFSCGGGSTSPSVMPGQPLQANASPGGIWSGTDSEGAHSRALIDEDGSLHFIDGTFARGAGLLTVINADSVAGAFSFPDRAGSTATGQTDYPDCKLAGDLAERLSMELDVSCKSLANQQVLTTLMLSFDPLYVRGSSPTVIAGDYDYGVSVVLAVGVDGSLFAQNASTGCVTNGRITPIDTAYNLYRILVMNENCSGQEAEFNGINFSGLAALDDSTPPSRLIFAVTGTNGESVLSVVRFVPRL